jgi:hypothetical protein
MKARRWPSECLHHELVLRGRRSASPRCVPELVATHIDTAERNRPAHLRPGPGAPGAAPERELVQQAIARGIATGTPPARIADRVLDAIREQRFYVLSEDAWRRSSEVRCEDVRLGRNPTIAPPVPG